MVGCLSTVRLYVKVLWSTLRHMLLVTLRNAAYCLVKGGWAMSMDDETDSRYTTGDIAKLTGVSVRTVQYYDAKGLLIPNEISDGGRRLYGTAEVERMRVILFLKGLGFKLEQIRSILSDERPERVLVDLLDQQTASLQSGIAEQKQRLDDCLQLRKALTVSASDFVSSTLTDMATVMNTTTTHSLHTTYLVMLAITLPATLLQIACLVIGVMTDVWWPLPVAVLLAIALTVAAMKYYRSRVQYLCPACHETFQPGMREFVFAAHTPKTRKLTCPHCGHRGYCMELSI